MRCLVPISNFPEKEGEQEKKNTKMKSIFCNGINKIITTINNDNNDDDDIASIRIGGKISRFYKKVFLLPEMNGEVTERRAGGYRADPCERISFGRNPSLLSAFPHFA